MISNDRRYEIKQSAYETLSKDNHPSLPLKIGKLIRSFPNIKLITYSSQIKKYQISYEQLIINAETKDSYVVYHRKKNKYCIYYNDLDKNITNSNRVRWNLAHELGHVVLKHHNMCDNEKLFRSNIKDELYNYLEDEADYFAQLILVPHAALVGFNIRNYRDIRTMCKISDPAAKRRFFEFSIWKKHIDPNDEYDNLVFNLFFPFIFNKECKHCGAGVIQRYGKFCPICGKKSLQWGEKKMKYQVKVKVNKDSKALRCPICDNEDIPSEGAYCNICGTKIVNQCTSVDSYGNGCGALADGNARYCIYCGAVTTFFHNGILNSWEEELKEETVELPADQLEDLNLIRQDWRKIIEDIGGPIRPSFRDTALEPGGDSCLCIVFSDQQNYDIGSRPTVLGQLEKYIEKQYGKKLYFKARMKNTGEHLKTIYVGDSELKKAIHMDIAIED